MGKRLWIGRSDRRIPSKPTSRIPELLEGEVEGDEG
jgi:hypothetical protein